MLEQISQLFQTAFTHVLSAFINKLVPMVGVGESVESVEVVELKTIYYAVALLRCSASFSVSPSLWSLPMFVVKVDPK